MPKRERERLEVVCKGAWILGSACGKCSRCIADAPRSARILYDDLKKLRGEIHGPLRQHCSINIATAAPVAHCGCAVCTGYRQKEIEPELRELMEAELVVDVSNPFTGVVPFVTKFMKVFLQGHQTYNEAKNGLIKALVTLNLKTRNDMFELMQATLRQQAKNE